MHIGASTEDLRHQNRNLVLSALRKHGALAHTDISQHTGLSSATVSVITTDLLEEEVLVKSETKSASGRGRPRVLLKQNSDAAFFTILRITSGELEFSLVDYCGTLKDRITVKREAHMQNTDTFLDRIKEGLGNLVARSKLSRGKIKVISISSKGIVDGEDRKLLWSPVFGSNQIDFVAALSPQWDAEILLTEETQFVSQAILRKMIAAQKSGKRLRVAALSLGHSIGLGVAQESFGNRVDAIAPPFGHMNHSPDGPLCRCGANGCVEAYAGFYGILRASFEVPDNTIPANFIPIEEMDKIAINARNGDRMAQYAFRQAGEVLGSAISRFFSLQKPMPVAITGPGLSYYDLMQESFEAAINANLSIRLEGKPSIDLYSDQSRLVFEGNVEHVLERLDMTDLNKINGVD